MAGSDTNICSNTSSLAVNRAVSVRRGRVARGRRHTGIDAGDGARWPRRWGTTSWSGCASGGSSRSSPTPATGSTASSRRSGRPTTRRRSSRAGTRRCRALQAVGYAKFSGKVGVCMATSGPGAIHLLNGLYDAKLDHVPVVAIVGQTERSAMGGSYQQEVDLQALLKDVASEYLVEVNVPEQLPLAIDRAIRTALTAPRARPRSSSRATCRPSRTARRSTRSSRSRPARRRCTPRSSLPTPPSSPAPPRSSTPGSGSRSWSARARAVRPTRSRRSPTCSAPASRRRCWARTC